MHDRVLFVPFLSAIHAGQLWSFQVSDRWNVEARHCSNDSASVMCDIVAMSRRPIGRAIIGGLACPACLTLITVGIIYPRHAAVNTFFIFF